MERGRGGEREWHRGNRRGIHPNLQANCVVTALFFTLGYSHLNHCVVVQLSTSHPRVQTLCLLGLLVLLSLCILHILPALGLPLSLRHPDSDRFGTRTSVVMDMGRRHRRSSIQADFACECSGTNDGYRDGSILSIPFLATRF